MSPSSKDWQKFGLAGGLLLVLAYGLLQIPEVRGWHSPGFLWEMKIRQLQKEGPTIERMLKRAEANLEALNDFQGQGPPAGSWNPRLRRAQSDCIGVGRRVRYLDAKLAALTVAVEKRIPGASPALAAKLNSFLDQIKAMHLQSLQYSFGLEYTLKKLRTVNLAQPDLRRERLW